VGSAGPYQQLPLRRALLPRAIFFLYLSFIRLNLLCLRSVHLGTISVLLLYLLRKLFLHDLFIDLQAALLLRARPTSCGGHRVGLGRRYFDERSLDPSLLRRRLLLLKR